MPWTMTTSVREFLDGAGDYLRADPREHTVELAVAETMLARGQASLGPQLPQFGGWRPDPGGVVTASAFNTPPFPLLLSGAAAAVRPMAAELAARQRPLAGVNGPPDLSGAFAAAWQELTGAGYAPSRRSRLFALDDLADPWPMPPGAARLAGPGDMALLRDWLADFAVEIGEAPAAEHGRPAEAHVADRLSYGGLTLWEAAGRPVSLAGSSRAAAGVTRIGPVFTPADCRGRGYGGAVTAAASRAALTAGTAAVLFTDLANPVSNALYPRLGYRPLSDRLVLTFRPA
jgi:GNAT superfamily N-acetyltransferase